MASAQGPNGDDDDDDDGDDGDDGDEEGGGGCSWTQMICNVLSKRFGSRR